MPTTNAIGPADWLEFWLTALLVASVFLWRPSLQAWLKRFSERTRVVMAVLFVSPILLRLALLGQHPVPVANFYDEFSHLLVADTLLHGRLANAAHPLPQFFETFFVLQRPTYSSIYPLGQGMMLAFGQLVSGVPWTGVLLATGALCSLSYWMLRAFVPAVWALAGGMLAVIQFGPLCLWMNCYWGGALPAAAGCLVFGALPRLGRSRWAAPLVGVGLGIHWLTRPFETLLLIMAMGLFFVVMRQRILVREAGLVALTFAPALLLTALHNKAVTDSMFTLPEALSQYQYGVPTTLTLQEPAMPHATLTREQEMEYRSQLLMHGPGRDTVPQFLLRLEYRVRDYRFFFLPPLYLALAAFLFTLRRRVSLWVAGSLAVFAFGTNLFPYLLPHYLAAATCLFLLAAVTGLRRIAEIVVHQIPIGAELARILLLLCFAEFGLWYGLHLFERPDHIPALLQYETWDSINHKSSARRRVLVAGELKRIPGKLLVFVRYSAHHIFQDEWVWNRADIDEARVVFARDLGQAEDEELRRFYPDRRVVFLEPDSEPPRLTTDR